MWTDSLITWEFCGLLTWVSDGFVSRKLCSSASVISPGGRGGEGVELRKRAAEASSQEGISMFLRLAKKARVQKSLRNLSKHQLSCFRNLETG